jgi:hypothetical protein
MRIASSLAATMFVTGCGLQTLELFPGSLPPGSDASTSDGDADSGSPATDAEFDVAAFEGGCQSNSDCLTQGENRFCQTGLHVCVQCLGGPNDCATQGTESVCNRVNNTCAVPCAPDGGCPTGDVCDSEGVCADCLDSTQCPANQPVCVSEECVCRTSADCPLGQTCNSDQTCH